MTNQTSAHPLEIAIEASGMQTLSEMARALGRTRGALAQWMEDGRHTPAEFCPRIERMTGGAVRCEQLNPRVDWTYLRGTSA
jgi:DNA-binding transcriptional regulator YdaS (Cro superfamily)